MDDTARELGFDAVWVAVAAALHFTYVLGLGVGPLPTGVAGVALVCAGAAVLAPRGDRLPAAAVALVAVALAGVAVPQYAVRSAWPGDPLALSLSLAGVVLALTVVALRVLIFERRPAPA
jgi:hypothetical protein